MSFSKLAVFAVAGAFAAANVPVLAAQQNPDSTAAPVAQATPAATVMPKEHEALDTADLIAKANAAAVANANAATVAPTRVIAPSAEAVKKARDFGFHAEIYDGKTMFCRDDATLGTRLVSRKCLNAFDFEDYAVQLKIDRDMLKQKNQCTGGDVCGESLARQSSRAR